MTCPACGAKVEAGSKFCDECGATTAGASANAGAPATEAASRFASPESYTPQHLAERIISSRGALEGERKQVTVLFADIKGSMELLADRDPEEARRILDPVLERMMEAVHRYEGTVNQVMGDGIMALFGAPIAHEDHAVRACYAALRMQESVKEYADEVRRREGVLIQIRVGLNSGEVVVRSIGSDLRMDYTAVGQTTHLAARMEQLAAPGSTLLAPSSLQLAEGYVQVRTLGPMAVKGLAEPVEVYELTGASTARSRLQATAARGLTKFVGRGAELETLRRTLEQASGGHGQVVALVGEPGVGKSRLVWEFSHSHRADGWLVLAAGSVSYGKATSYLPVIDLLKSYCGIEDRDDGQRIREKLTGKVLTLDPTLQPTLPALLALLDVPVQDEQWDALDPPQRRQRTLDALKRLLLRERQRQPLLLVFEDLHWIDSETQALLDSLVESLPTARILLLVNYRPEYEHTWHRKTYYQQLRLDPLPAASAMELLDALLGKDGGLAPLRWPLIERTEGNPFFLEETVQSLVESGVLAGQRGAYSLARPFETTQVPATVQAVLAARIDRLVPQDKRLLQAAAVIGKDVPYPLLQAIAELPGDALNHGLARLQAAEFLYEASLYPEPEYTFKHALTHEVAYGSLLQERRRGLHARIVDAIEHLYPDRLAEHVERLAHHAQRGELWEPAVAYSRQAGLKADARSAQRETLSYLEQAIDALGHLPDTPEKRRLAIDLRLDLHSPLHILGQFDSRRSVLADARTFAEGVGDAPRLAHVIALQANSLWWTGDPTQALEHAEQAARIANDLDDPELQVRTAFYTGMIHHSQGNYPQAASQFRRTLDLIPDKKRGAHYGMVGPAAVGTLHFLVWTLAECGDFQDTDTLMREMERVLQRTGRTTNDTWGYLTSGYLHLLRGDTAEAARVLGQGLAICEATSVKLLLPRFTSALGYAYALAGRTEEALPLLECGVEQGNAFQLLALQSLRVAWLGEGYLIAHRQAEARSAAHKALELAHDHRERASEAKSLHLHGEVAASADPPEVEQAETYYRQAHALAEDLGMRPLQAHCHLGLGTLYQKLGRDQEAQAELETAAEAYRAMEMPYWLEKAEAALVRR
jgi:class 3 adenylate cyclase/tetratricopeptide (TPR) repeat protein